MDAAQLWQLAALLARIDPDSYLLGLTAAQTARYGEIKAIAQGSVSAGRLRCLAHYQNPDQNPVLMSEFLRWAQSKEIPIPPELTPQEEAGAAFASAAASAKIEGMQEMRALIKELGGPTFGADDKGVREFLYGAAIIKRGTNLARNRRSWNRAEVEPLLQAAIARWRQRQPE